MTPVTVRLREVRLAKGLTQEQLAAAANVRQGTISDLELQKARRIDLDIIERLAEALGVDALALLGETPAKPKRRK